MGDGRGHAWNFVGSHKSNICCQVSFIAITTNKFIAIDNTQWLSIHLYVVQQWKRIPIFLCVEIVIMFTTFNNIFVSMLKFLFEFDGLVLEELVGKLVNIGCDDENVFQSSHRTKVTLLFKEKVAPFVIGVHYFVQKVNLVVITLFNVLLVHRL